MHASVCMHDIHQKQQACACVNVLLCTGRKDTLTKAGILHKEVRTSKLIHQVCIHFVHEAWCDVYTCLF